MKIYYNVNNKKTINGFSLIAMLIIIMVISLMLLISFSQLLSTWQVSINLERRYYLRFNQASSSLQWAMTKNWSTANEHWQCQQDLLYQFKACIKKSSLQVDDYILVRAEFEGYYHYQLTHYNNGLLRVERGHWLDYCPAKNERDCE